MMKLWKKNDEGMEEEDEEMMKEWRKKMKKLKQKFVGDGALLDMVDMQNLMVSFSSKKSNG